MIWRSKKRRRIDSAYAAIKEARTADDGSVQAAKAIHAAHEELFEAYQDGGFPWAARRILEAMDLWDGIILSRIRSGDILYAYRGGKCVGEFAVSVEPVERCKVFGNLKL